MHEAGVLDELKVAGLTLRGITRGGVETCVMVPELGVMFDVGMCPPGAMKFDTILVSHGHADHLGGVAYLASQRQLMRAKPPTVHVPEEILAPLRTILQAWAQIEDFDLQCDLHGHAPGDRVEVGRGLTAVALRSTHRVPSIGWLIERTTKGLLPDFVGASSQQLVDLRKAGVAVTEARVEPLLCVSGDTQIEFFEQHEQVRRCKVLVHEVTSWKDDRTPAQTRQWGHTHLDEMIARAEEFTGEALVLVHRSMRYTRSEAERLVRERFPAGVRDRVHVFGR